MHENTQNHQQSITHREKLVLGVTWGLPGGPWGPKGGQVRKRAPKGSSSLPPGDQFLTHFQEKRGNPVLFSREFREKILQHKGEGCRDILQEYPQCVMEVMMENDNVFRDVDTPEDYILNSRS